MNHRLCLCAFLATLSAALNSAPAEQIVDWSPSLIRKEAAWQKGHGALIRSTDSGLRVEIAPSRTCGMAFIPAAHLPKHLAEVRVRVSDKSKGSLWFTRFYGDISDSNEPFTLSVFHPMQITGQATRRIDPRLLNLTREPAVQVQLGLKGTPGDYVVFESLELRPAETRQPSKAISGQIDIACVEMMPNMPQPYEMRDWRSVARDYDAFVFDFNATGEHLPLVWLDNSRINIERPTFGLCSYVGDGRRGSSNQEGITALGAVLGATLVGIDKSAEQHNYVAMIEAFYNRRNKQNLVLNAMHQGTGGSFWYEIWPSILYSALADRYPEQKEVDAIVRATADRWFEAYQAMGGHDGQS